MVYKVELKLTTSFGLFQNTCTSSNTTTTTSDDQTTPANANSEMTRVAITDNKQGEVLQETDNHTNNIHGFKILHTTLQNELKYNYKRKDQVQLQEAPWGGLVTVVGVETSDDYIELEAVNGRLVKLSEADKLEIQEYLNAIYRRGNALHNPLTYVLCFQEPLALNIEEDNKNKNDHDNENEFHEEEDENLRRLLTALRLFGPGYVELYDATICQDKKVSKVKEDKLLSNRITVRTTSAL